MSKDMGREGKKNKKQSLGLISLFKRGPGSLSINNCCWDHMMHMSGAFASLRPESLLMAIIFFAPPVSWVEGGT